MNGVKVREFGDPDGRGGAERGLLMATRSGDVQMQLATQDGALPLESLEVAVPERFHANTLKKLFPGIRVHRTYAEYSAVLHARLGIGANGDGAKALRLLARIQAGNQVRSVDELYKDMVLERPSTFAAADRAIEHFDDLDTAHSAMRTEEQKLELLAPIAVAAYSYMSLIPIIQPPLMKLLTTRKERLIRMDYAPRPISQRTLVIFPVALTVVVGLLVPEATPLISMLMLGNLLKVSGVVPRLSKAAENEIINIATLFLGLVVGATAPEELARVREAAASDDPYERMLAIRDPRVRAAALSGWRNRSGAADTAVRAAAAVAAVV